jgi:hypothetical protein
LNQIESDFVIVAERQNICNDTGLRSFWDATKLNGV